LQSLRQVVLHYQWLDSVLITMSCEWDVVLKLMRPHTTYVEQCFILLYYIFVENTADRTGHAYCYVII